MGIRLGKAMTKLNIGKETVVTRCFGYKYTNNL